MQTPVFGITGWKNSGKTTLITGLVAEFSRRGLCVSTVKHAHHAFDIDHPGRDSFRHREAGAQEVAIVSGNRWALMHELRDESEPTLTEILPRLSPCDLILIEGFKRHNHPKLEVRLEPAKDQVPVSELDPNIVAIASNQQITGFDRPSFLIDDVTKIADFISNYLQLEPSNDLSK